MKLLISLMLVAILGVVGYGYYLRSRPPALTAGIPVGINLIQVPTDLTNVLGESTTSLWERGLEALNNVTNDQAEPLINKAVSDLKERVKELPEAQYQRVKYEFCKDIISSPGVSE